MRGDPKSTAIRCLIAAVAMTVATPPARAQFLAPTIDSSATMRVAIGTARTVRLPETFSGYHWIIDPMASRNLSLVRVVDLGPSRPPLMGTLTGIAGIHSWRIRGLSTGTARLIFVYAQPGATGTPARRHLATVDVRLR